MTIHAKPSERKNRYTLSVTLALTFALLCFVVLLVSNGLEFYFNYRAQQRIIVSEQQVISQNTATKVQNYIDDKINSLQTGAGVIDLSVADESTRDSVISRLLGRDPSFRSILLFDTDGKELGFASHLATPTIPSAQQLSDIRTQIQTNDLYISPVYFDDVTSEPLVYIAVPIKNVFGDTKGVMVADVNLKFMWEVVSAIQTSTGRTTYVVDKQGNLIAFIDTARVLKGENLSSLREVGQFVNDTPDDSTTAADISTGILGTSVVTTHTALTTPNWGVVIELPVSVAYGPLIQEFIQSMWVVVITLILAIVSGIFFARRITRPLSQLSKAVKSITAGGLKTRIEINTNNEIGQLADAFNDMTVQLAQSYDGLDQKIQEKTAELSLQIEQGEKNKRAILNLLEDIEGEKKKAEETVVERTRELRDEKARLLASINSLSFGFVLADIDHKIILKNPALMKILEIKGNPITIHDISNSFDSVGVNTLKFDLAASCKECIDLKRTLEIKEVPYGQKYLRVFCAPISSEGLATDKHDTQDIIGYVFIVEDITEAKVMERSREEFFAVASHELRTPLTAIRGNADMILDMYADKIVDTDMKEMLTDIDSSSIRLIDIVNDFLEVSRLEQGRIVITKEEFDITEVVAKVERNLKEMIAKKGIALVYTPPPALLPHVFSDKNRVEQILINLIGNSTKFTKEGSITIVLSQLNNFIKVQVTDTGIGISESNQALLFRKFQQAGEQVLARDVTQGTGLGLYICRQLIGQMGGTIGLEKSELGRGSVFAFTVPIVA